VADRLADGMAVGDAPLKWSDTENVRWQTDIPGLGNSSPVIWGDQIFITTAIPTGAGGAATAPAPAPPAGRGGRMGMGSVPQTYQMIQITRAASATRSTTGPAAMAPTN
jgi:hypothetical protein